MQQDYGIKNLLPWGRGDRKLSAPPVVPGFGALAAFVAVYLALMFAWLGWWGALAALMYFPTVVVLGVVISPSELSARGKAALIVVVPAVCIGLLAAIPKAMGLI